MTTVQWVAAAACNQPGKTDSWSTDAELVLAAAVAFPCGTQAS